MQVSNQCMALVNDKIIVPTKVPCSSIIVLSLSIILSKDAPELAYIVESSEAQYIPDVFFMQKDEYGNEIKKIGRPLPVEYLLIDVPVTTPLQVTLHAFHLVCFVIILVWIINPISSHCKPSLLFLPAKILSLLKTASLNPAYRLLPLYFTGLY